MTSASCQRSSSAFAGTSSATGAISAPEDMQLNEAALKTGARLMGAYTTKRGGKIWIITEAADDNGQRAATTVLLPDEY